MPDQTKPVARPWRRFLRFSVRGLIVLVLVIGGWFGWVVRSARIQREAVAAIKNAGGIVYYGWEYSDSTVAPGQKPRVPTWLVDLIGVDYFGHVTAVGFFNPIDDKVFVQVGRLSGLQLLYLDGTSTSDAELAHLKSMTRLSFLSVRSTQISDAGLECLKA